MPPEPPPFPTATRNSHVIDYHIYGDDMQLLEIELDPGETVIAEAGSMCFMEEEIEFESKMATGPRRSADFSAR